MTFELLLTVRAAEGSLVRVFGLVGRRGWDVVAASVRPAADERMRHVELRVRGDGRGGEVIARQMAKLYDVVHVEWRSEGTSAASTTSTEVTRWTT
jgi:acetolactate synthase regulatory subunit